MNWRRLLERIGTIIVIAVAGTLAGGTLGSLYYRMSETASAWDGLGMVLGGLAIGCGVGFIVGVYLAVRLDDRARRKALLMTFVFDLVAIFLLAITDFLD